MTIYYYFTNGVLSTMFEQKGNPVRMRLARTGENVKMANFISSVNVRLNIREKLVQVIGCYMYLSSTCVDRYILILYIYIYIYIYIYYIYNKIYINK